MSGSDWETEDEIELVSGSGVSGGAAGAAAASAAPDSLEELYSLVRAYAYICIQYGHSDCGCPYHGSVCWWAHCTRIRAAAHPDLDPKR